MNVTGLAIAALLVGGCVVSSDEEMDDVEADAIESLPPPSRLVE